MAKPAPQLRVSRPHKQPGDLARPLRVRRFSAGITLQEAARTAGLSLSQASRLERGMTTNPGDLAALDAAIEKLAAGPRS